MPYSDPEAQKTYQREWLQKRRAAWLEGKACVQCGSTDRLEIDHIDPATKSPLLKKTKAGTHAGTAALWSWSEERRAAELALTQILCHACHRMKTYGWDSPEMPHGIGMYNRGRCRCDICVETNRARLRRQRVDRPRPVTKKPTRADQS